jgi:hypothetical protein
VSRFAGASFSEASVAEDAKTVEVKQRNQKRGLRKGRILFVCVRMVYLVLYQREEVFFSIFWVVTKRKKKKKKKKKRRIIMQTKWGGGKVIQLIIM